MKNDSLFVLFPVNFQQDQQSAFELVPCVHVHLHYIKFSASAVTVSLHAFVDPASADKATLMLPNLLVLQQLSIIMFIWIYDGNDRLYLLNKQK